MSNFIELNQKELSAVNGGGWIGQGVGAVVGINIGMMAFSCVLLGKKYQDADFRLKSGGGNFDVQANVPMALIPKYKMLRTIVAGAIVSVFGAAFSIAGGFIGDVAGEFKKQD